MKKETEQYTDLESAKRAEEAIRRSFAMPHKPRKAIVPATTRGTAQRQRRSKGSLKSK
ncbi:MAG TPA: hypothetical protein VG328_23520 [Stellaceae bacterium]|nr:hypothetical protein [Stellaceae bacterium]